MIDLVIFNSSVCENSYDSFFRSKIEAANDKGMSTGFAAVDF